MRAKAITAFIAIRAGFLLTLYLVAHYREVNFFTIFKRWDAQWYRGIAENGYGAIVVAPDGRQLSDYAFFPLYPLAERWVHKLTSMTVLHSGLLISAVASIAAALGIYTLVEHLKSPRIALYVTIGWAVLPIAGVQWLAYSESLFTALAIWALYCALKRNWYAAAFLSILAGLTRPIGIAVALAVMSAAWIHIHRHRSDRSAWAALLISPLGWLGYLAWVGKQVGEWNGYLTVTDGWKNSIDGGRSFIKWLIELFHATSPIATIAIVVAIGLLLTLLWALNRQKIASPLVVYSATIVILALITSGYFSSKPRYLLPAVPLLIPIASWISHQRRSNVKYVFVAMMALSYGYGAYWLTGNGPL